MLKFLRIVATVLVVLACGSSATTRVDAAAGWLSKLDPLLQGQRSLTGRSRVILRVANAGAISPVLSLVQLTGGHLRSIAADHRRGRRRSAERIPAPSRRQFAGASRVDGSGRGRRHGTDRRDHRRDRRPPGAGLRRLRRRRRRHRLGRDAVARRPCRSRDRRPARRWVRRFGERAPRRRTTTTATAPTWPASSPATASTPSGARSGIAPGAQLIVLKVLDGSGRGRISDVIAALDYVVREQGRVQHPRRQSLGGDRRVPSRTTTIRSRSPPSARSTAGIVVVAAAGQQRP